MWIKKPLVLIMLVITVFAVFSSRSPEKTEKPDVIWTHKIFEFIQIVFLLWVSIFLVIAFFGGKDMI